MNEEHICFVCKKTFEEIKRKEKMKQQIFQNMDAMLEGEVKKSGSGGHLIIPKKYLGRKAKVIILEKKEDKKSKVLTPHLKSENTK